MLTFGLGFLIGLIKPLDDALKLVTGDEEQLTLAAKHFEKVATDLKALSKQFAGEVEGGLASRQGEAADASRGAARRVRGRDRGDGPKAAYRQAFYASGVNAECPHAARQRG